MPIQQQKPKKYLLLKDTLRSSVDNDFVIFAGELFGENNPDWFKEIIKPSDDNFVWTDELVMEIVGIARRDGFHNIPLSIVDRVQSFKLKKKK